MMHQAFKVARRGILQGFAAMLAAGCKPQSSWLAARATSARGVKWIPFYGESADEQTLSAYDLVVLDPTFKGSKTAITQAGARICGYLSLAEIRTADAVYARLDPAARLDENPAWPGTRRIDIRHKSWTDLVVTDIVPAIIAAGFTGLLLDTLDTPPYLERQNPDAYHGMRHAAIELVRTIRRANPTILLIMNRGYDLLPDVAGNLDAVVAESLLTAPDEVCHYKRNTEAEINAQLSLLAPIQRGNLRLPILSLDYWEPEDVGTIRQIYSQERQLGHHPYVATRMLDTIIQEPII